MKISSSSLLTIPRPGRFRTFYRVDLLLLSIFSGAVFILFLSSIVHCSSNTHLSSTVLNNFGQYSYQVFLRPLPWMQAEDRCEQHGGHLVSFYSAEEFNHVQNIVHQNLPPQTSYWTGLQDHQKPKSNNWRWSDGLHLIYSNWETDTFIDGDDDHTFETRDCTMVLGSSKWNNTYCSLRLPFVCKYLANCSNDCKNGTCTNSLMSAQSLNHCKCVPGYFLLDCSKMDPTPPLIGSIIDIFSVFSQGYIAAAWYGFDDPESGIMQYEYAIGTEEEEESLVKYTEVPFGRQYAQAERLKLNQNHTYFVCVKAYNSASLYVKGCSGGVNAESRRREPKKPNDEDDDYQICQYFNGLVCPLNDLITLIASIFSSIIFLMIAVTGSLFCLVQQHQYFQYSLLEAMEMRSRRTARPQQNTMVRNHPAVGPQQQEQVVDIQGEPQEEQGTEEQGTEEQPHVLTVNTELQTESVADVAS